MFLYSAQLLLEVSSYDQSHIAQSPNQKYQITWDAIHYIPQASFFLREHQRLHNLLDVLHEAPLHSDKETYPKHNILAYHLIL